MGIRRGHWPTSIEDVLGPAEGRFFGRGYLGVRHILQGDPTVNPSGSTTAMAEVRYPEAWSLDASGKTREPHLSTLDAVILPLLTLSQHRDSDFQCAYVSRVDLHAGGTAWGNLANGPVTVTPSATEARAEEIFFSQFDAKADNIRSTMWVSHSKHRPQFEASCCGS
ncbi:AvrD family protein [Micrococcus luteus]|uniref:AvrD family protein n=1 Tax=Micrococcus luteus TaxID=1270 RepID=UPI0034E46277